jgi:hypothetical protein
MDSFFSNTLQTSVTTDHRNQITHSRQSYDKANSGMDTQLWSHDFVSLMCTGGNTRITVSNHWQIWKKKVNVFKNRVKVNKIIALISY